MGEDDDGPSPIIFCGPSGVGKSVLIKKLLEVFPGKFGFSVSHTTRGPRPGEADGKDYNFSDYETMKREVEEGLFIESAEVHGNMYGTSREAVEAVRREGKICILDIDVQGAQTIFDKSYWPSTKFIFVHPPSLEELERRLRGRGTETEERVQKRLGAAVGEIEFSKRVSFFSHTLILDGLSGVCVPLEAIELMELLTRWYPSLGELPVNLQALKLFLEAYGGKPGNASVPREELDRIFQVIDTSITSDDVNKLIDLIVPAEKGGAATVDIAQFLAGVMR